MQKVSAVIPTYNGERFIRKTVESVLAQTYRSLEVIVVDDCSGDDTRGAIADYIDEGRVVYIRRDVNGGIAAGRNTGLRAATGDYIAMLDHDDLWEADKVEKQTDFLTKSGKDFVFTDFYAEKDGGERVRFPSKKLSGTSVMDDLLRENIIYTSTVLFKRELLDRAGLLDEGFTYCEDWDWWLRIAREADMGYLPEYLATRREMPTSFSVLYTSKYRYYLKLYEKHAPRMDVRRRRVFKKHIGKKMLVDARKLFDAGLYIQGLRAYVESVKKYGPMMLKFPSLLKHCIRENRSPAS